MKYKFLNIVAFVGMASTMLSSCIKDDYEELTDQGKTFIKIAEAPENQIFFEPFTDVRKVDLFGVRKDAATNAALNTASAVKLLADTAMIGAYNREHDTEFEPLPDSLYTLGEGVQKNGNEYTLSLAPGDFAKEFSINLNGAKWDLARKYALGLKITDSAGLNLKTGGDEVLVFISIKNKYDGIYSVVSGTVTRYTAPGAPAGDALSGSLAGNADVALATSGPNSVSIPPPGTGGLQWGAGSGSYVAGIDGLEVVIDPATNLTTITSALNPTLANWAGKENRYDPETKTFYLGFKWNPTANVREYEVVLKYKGPR
jgi:hypothetical protein